MCIRDSISPLKWVRGNITFSSNNGSIFPDGQASWNCLCRPHKSSFQNHLFSLIYTPFLSSSFFSSWAINSFIKSLKNLQSPFGCLFAIIFYPWILYAGAQNHLFSLFYTPFLSSSFSNLGLRNAAQSVYHNTNDTIAANSICWVIKPPCRMFALR